MASTKRKVLITGCSDGSMGAALAIAFHEAGLHVYATARNPVKLGQVKAHGIETLQLDVLSDESIGEAAKKVPELDILVNNAGAGYGMPIADTPIPEAKKLFDLNVWSYLAVTQAFLPALLKTNGLIVNQTSVVSGLSIPFQATYNASKAAMASYSGAMRLELGVLGVKVVELKTGTVKTNIFAGVRKTLPTNSLYTPAKAAVERIMRAEDYIEAAENPDEWAKNVVQDLLKREPPAYIWRGAKAGTSHWLTGLPHVILDWTIKKLMGISEVERELQE